MLVLGFFFTFIYFFFLWGQVLVVALGMSIMHVPQHACGGQRATHRSHSSKSSLVGPRVRAQVMGFDGQTPVTTEPTR